MIFIQGHFVELLSLCFQYQSRQLLAPEIVISCAPTPSYSLTKCNQFVHSHTRCFVPLIKCKYRTYFLYAFCFRIRICELINIIIYCYPQCYEYLMMFEKLFQILVSVLDSVSKSHVALTIKLGCASPLLTPHWIQKPHLKH